MSAGGHPNTRNANTLLVLALVTIAATVIITLLLSHHPRPLTTWVVLGYFCWGELLLFGYSIRNCLVISKRGDTGRAIVSQALASYVLVGLATVLGWVYFNDLHLLNTVLAWLLGETVVLAIVLTSFLMRSRNFEEQDRVSDRENARPLRDLLGDLGAVRKKIAELRQSHPEWLVELNSLEKTMRSVMTLLGHSGTAKKDEQLVNQLYGAIGQLSRTAGQGQNPVDPSGEVIHSLRRHLDEIDSLAHQLVS